jgi:hypothetical protein
MESPNRPWPGETGSINEKMLSRRSKAAASPIYYIAGPPGMVKGLHEMLDDADDIRAEDFVRY